MLDGVQDLAGLWAAEEQWWTTLETDAEAMLARARFGRDVVVGAAALLAADARRVRAALITSAHGVSSRAGGNDVG
jgi:hypothetical protein